MTDNKQNSESKNAESATGNKTVTGSAASTKQAKDETSAPKSGNGDAGAGKETFDKVKESAGTLANQAFEKAQEKAASVIDEQKTNLASGINTVADSIRQIGENLSSSDEQNQVAALAGKYGDSLAGQIEKFSSYVDEREIRELVSDVEQFARRNPLLFVGGAFALGILAARFLKSSGQKQSSKSVLRNTHAKTSAARKS